MENYEKNLIRQIINDADVQKVLTELLELKKINAGLVRNPEIFFDLLEEKGKDIFSTTDEMYSTLKTALQEDVSSYFSTSNNKITAPIIDEQKRKELEDIRSQMVEQLENVKSGLFSNEMYVDHKIFLEEIKVCSVEKISLFNDYFESRKTELIEYYENLLQQNKNDELYRKNYATLVDYYKTTGFECLIPILYMSSAENDGNIMTSVHISRKIVSKQDSDAKLLFLQLVSNHIESNKYLPEGIKFYGSYFIDKNEDLYHEINIVNEMNIVKNLQSFNYSKQAKFSYDEGKANYFFRAEKNTYQRSNTRNDKKWQNSRSDLSTFCKLCCAWRL